MPELDVAASADRDTGPCRRGSCGHFIAKTSSPQSRAPVRSEKPFADATVSFAAFMRQERGSIRCVYDLTADKSRFCISANRTRIAWCGMDDHDTRCSGQQQAVCEGADESRSVTAIEHVAFTDKLVQTTRAGGLRTEAAIPGTDIVALQICEIPSVCGNNELGYVRMTEIAAHEFELLGQDRATIQRQPARRATASKSSANRQRSSGGMHSAASLAQSVDNASIVRFRFV